LLFHQLGMSAFAAAAVVDEDTGNYTCELRGPQSQVLRQITHYLFVRGNTLLHSLTSYVHCYVRYVMYTVELS